MASARGASSQAPPISVQGTRAVGGTVGTRELSQKDGARCATRPGRSTKRGHAVGRAPAAPAKGDGAPVPFEVRPPPAPEPFDMPTGIAEEGPRTRGGGDGTIPPCRTANAPGPEVNVSSAKVRGSVRTWPFDSSGALHPARNNIVIPWSIQGSISTTANLRTTPKHNEPAQVCNPDHCQDQSSKTTRAVHEERAPRQGVAKMRETPG